ncbi:hypothetical protein E4U41_001430 [Claviceps citrina]|nr:hypothetical protein E4U41_001430 [Claviceps citrina]
MSMVPVLQRRVDVDNNFLPGSAVKLVVTQYLECEDITHWAWIIVGTFFDSQDQPLWSTEIFIAQLGIDSESEFGDSDSDSDSDRDSTAVPYHRAGEDSWSAIGLTEERQGIQDWAANSYAEQHRQFPPSIIYPAPIIASFSPPIWDPVVQGPVPGHWQARFDPDLRRWVHTWQPQF